MGVAGELFGGLELGQLGDVICVEGDCKLGEGQVAQLRAFFDSIKVASVKNKYESAVAAIVGSFDEAEGKLSRHLPFSTVCCEIKAIGLQAAKLQAQIAVDAGVASPAQLEPPSGVETLAQLGALAIGAYVGVKLLQEWLHSRKGKR